VDVSTGVEGSSDVPVAPNPVLVVAPDRVDRLVLSFSLKDENMVGEQTLPCRGGGCCRVRFQFQWGLPARAGSGVLVQEVR
jgi:hypothetical protein